MTIGIVIGSTRQGTLGKPIGDWVLSEAKGRDVTYELVDVVDYKLPLLGESDATEHAKAWKKTIDRLDGFIFLTAEYNHSITASLKNALDFALAEWANKPAGIVSYGYAGGARAAEHLRTILGALAVADVKQHVLVNLNTEINANQVFVPASHQSKLLAQLFREVEAWAKALKTIR